MLLQDLPRAGLPGHAIREPKDHLAHDVLIDPAARWLPSGRLKVNSRHHQAASRVAGRLRVVGRAPDGVIEAVEGIDESRFSLGVQWHPENLAARKHVDIFRTFREACLEPGPDPSVFRVPRC
jgi:putative glutamine amidotransferase